MRARGSTWLLLLALATSGCVDVPGASAGEACNSNGICATGLTCDEGICRASADASHWTPMLTPYDSTIYAVWGRSASDVYAVGDKGRVFHYGGSGLDWTEDKHGLTTSALKGVWGNASELWAVGANVILRRDKGGWTEQTVQDSKTSAPLEGTFGLEAIAGDGAQVYAAGRGPSQAGIVLRYQGGVWQTVDDAALSFAAHGLCVVGEAVYVVGDAQHVKHFDGSRWGEQNLPERVALNAVWGNASTLLAVGAGADLYRGGTSWKKLPAARASYAANAIWGPSADELYVVGMGSGYSESFKSIERCTASAGTCVPNLMPVESRAKKLYGIWGHAQTLFAVGESGLILRRSP